MELPLHIGFGTRRAPRAFHSSRAIVRRCDAFGATPLHNRTTEIYSIKHSETIAHAWSMMQLFATIYCVLLWYVVAFGPCCFTSR